MPEESALPLHGRCTCGAVRCRMANAPLFMHCCHCRRCQRETGASFALNAMTDCGATMPGRARP